jgi:pimeloyl-ACP methyl ester carboxylesterase
MQLIESLRNQIIAAHRDNEFCMASSSLVCGLEIEVTDGEASTVIVVIEAGQNDSIVLHASASVWREIMRPHPPVGLHSFTAALRQESDFRVDGSTLHIAQSLHAIERLFEIFRGQVGDDPLATYLDLQQIQGHYAQVELNSNRTQIYYEQSGNPDSPTLLMLHTAGADARQFHPIMADIQLQQQWNMIAFDMPSHGRSMPLANALWQEYKLTKESYINICQAFIEQVIHRPVVMLGCSMGAAMALNMAAVCPDIVAGVIALEAPFRAVGRRTDMLTNPQVNQATHNPSYVRGLMSPISPLAWRRIAAWIYSQGGYQVYSGDLVFYSEEFHADIDLRGIDGMSKDIVLLTGSYDYSATPADSQKVAELIPGARFIQMPDLGHFPMIENPVHFIKYLKPELEYIRARLSI